MIHAEAEPRADAGEIAAFIARLSRAWPSLGEPAMMEFRFLGEERTPSTYRFDPLDAQFREDAAAHAAAMAQRGMNCYVVVNPIVAERAFRRGASEGARDEDILAGTFAWIDCDDAESAVRARAFAGPRYAFSVITGTRPHVRPHVYWELAEPVRDLAAWRETQVTLARAFGSDPVVVNPSRIMRLPGTINWPPQRKIARGYAVERVTLRASKGGGPVALEALRDAAEAIAPPARHSPPAAAEGGFAFDVGAGALTGLDRAMAEAKIKQGENWHDNVIRTVASYVARGLSDTEIHRLSADWTLPGWTGEQTAREVQVAIDGARRKGWAPDAYAAPAELETTAFDAPPSPPGAAEAEPSRLEWFDEIEPAIGGSYLVKGLIDRGSMSVVYGPSNSGKTFFALDLAFHVAIGGIWRDKRVKGGGVLYLAAEGGRGIVNRIAALRLETGVCDVPFALRRAGLDLLKSTADLQQIVDLAAEVHARAPLALIVVDTLSRVIAGGDENSAADMTAFIRNIDKVRAITGAHIMIVHHTGKDAARGARGHSSLRAATDTEIEVQVEEGNRAASVTKQRDHEGGDVFAFSLRSVHLGTDDDGDDVSSCVLEVADADEFAAAKTLTRGLGGNQKIIADAFDQMLGEGMGKPNPGGVGMPEPGTVWCVPLEALRAVARGKMDSADTRGAWNQAWKALRDDRGLFCAGMDLAWRVDRKIK